MTEQAAAIATRSAALFNNRRFITVVTVISEHVDPTSFTIRQIASAADLPDSLVRLVIQRLLDAGLILEVGRREGARSPRHLRTNPEGPWPELQALCAALARLDAPAQT